MSWRNPFRPRSAFAADPAGAFGAAVASQPAAVPPDLQVAAKFAVRYRREVIQPRKLLGVPYWRAKVVSARDWHRNLILDVGLDMPASYAISTCFRYLALGTGSRGTKRDSGPVTATKVGNTITASAGFFVAEDQGRLLKFDTGQEYKIEAVGSPTEVTTASADNVPASEFTVWYTNYTNHEAEFYRSNAVDPAAGNNGSSFLVDTWTHQRVFLTSAFAADRQVTEIGWSPLSAAGANLFGRDLIPGGGDFVAAGQQYRVTVQLAVTYGPNGATPHPNVGTGGWNTTGQFGLEGCAVAPVAADGGEGAGGYLEFYNNDVGLVLTTETLAIRSMIDTYRSISGYPTQTVNGASIQPYTSGSCLREWLQTHGPTQANSTTLRSLWWSSTSYRRGIARVLFDTNQTKSSLYKLTLRFRWGWGRVLVN